MYEYIIIIGLVFMFLFVKYIFKNYQIRKAGKDGEKFALNQVKKFIAGTGASVYNNLMLPLYDGATEIDMLIVAPQGLICIENKHVVGLIKGKTTDKYWKQIKKHEKKKMYNPIFQNEGHIKCLKYHFNKRQCLDIPIIGYVIFSNNKAKLGTDMSNVGTLEDFKRFYTNFIVGKKPQLNVNKICRIVDNIKK